MLHLEVASLSGSNVSLCQDRLLESLGATGRPETMELTTLEKASSQSRIKVLSLTVTDLEGREMVELPRVYSRTDLHLSPDNLVSQGEVEQWPHLRDLPLHYTTVEEVTLLIGQDCPEALIPLTTVPGAWGEPYAIRTRLGWTVNGPISRRKKAPPVMPLHARREQGRTRTTPREGGQVLEVGIDGDIRVGEEHVSQQLDGASEMEGGSHV